MRLVSTLFFFQAEDGIRDWSVTGVQTCALPIWKIEAASARSEEVRWLRKEQKTLNQRVMQLEVTYGTSATDLRRAMQIVERSGKEAGCAKQELIEANLRLVVS